MLWDLSEQMMVSYGDPESFSNCMVYLVLLVEVEQIGTEAKGVFIMRNDWVDMQCGRRETTTTTPLFKLLLARLTQQDRPWKLQRHRDWHCDDVKHRTRTSRHPDVKRVRLCRRVHWVWD